jgi:hypothetical protein
MGFEPTTFCMASWSRAFRAVRLRAPESHEQARNNGSQETAEHSQRLRRVPQMYPELYDAKDADRLDHNQNRA